MSTLKTSNVQVGQSGTATNNFTLYQPTSPDGTVRLAVGNSGATTSDVMTVSNTGAVTFSGTVTASSFVGAGLILQSVQAISFAAAKGKSYPVNTTSGAVTVTLPAAPAAGDSINVFDYANKAATNNITISPNGGKISGGTNNLVLNTSGISVTLVYVDSTQGWEPVNYDAFQNLNGKSWTYFTSSGTYTVPAGVTSIRGYACGKGGNGAASGTGTPYGGSGGGGGMAYGDIAVTPGQTVTVTISAGVATLAIGATTYLTGNPGGNASTSTGGTAGTASKDASVTNGGAYSGGAGTNGSAQAGSGGASAGSPLGNGYSGAVSGGGGGGIGGAGGGSGGGGAGGAGAANFGGGAGGAASSVNPGAGRAFNARFTDPLLVNAVSPGGAGTFSGGTGTYAGPGGGGGSGTYPTPGGDFGGGGGQNGGPGAAGGLMGGGGGASSTAGNGGLGGGGGGTVSGQTAGTGGGAFVFIYA